MDITRTIETRLTAIDGTGSTIETVNRKLLTTANRLDDISKNANKSRRSIASIVKGAAAFTPIGRGARLAGTAISDLANTVRTDLVSDLRQSATESASLTTELELLKAGAEDAAVSIGEKLGDAITKFSNESGLTSRIRGVREDIAFMTGTQGLGQLTRELDKVNKAIADGAALDDVAVRGLFGVGRRSVGEVKEFLEGRIAEINNSSLAAAAKAAAEKRAKDEIRAQKAAARQVLAVRKRSLTDIERVETEAAERRQAIQLINPSDAADLTARVDAEAAAKIKAIQDKAAADRRAAAEMREREANRFREENAAAREVIEREAERSRDEAARAAATREKAALDAQNSRVTRRLTQLAYVRESEKLLADEREAAAERLLEKEGQIARARSQKFSDINSIIGSAGSIVDSFQNQGQDDVRQQFADRAEQIKEEREKLREAIRNGNAKEIADAKSKVDQLTALDARQDAQQRARFEKYKKFQTAIALASAFSAAAQTLGDISNLTPFGKIAAYASVLATGLSAVNSIRSLQYQSQAASSGGVGGSSTPEASSPSVSSDIANAANETPTSLTIFLDGVAPDSQVSAAEFSEKVSDALSTLLRRNVSFRNVA